jgi:hypothetical protein
MFRRVNHNDLEARQVRRCTMSQRCARWKGGTDCRTQSLQSSVVENCVGSRCGLLCNAPLVEIDLPTERTHCKGSPRAGGACLACQVEALVSQREARDGYMRVCPQNENSSGCPRRRPFQARLMDGFRCERGSRSSDYCRSRVAAAPMIIMLLVWAAPLGNQMTFRASPTDPRRAVSSTALSGVPLKEMHPGVRVAVVTKGNVRSR